MLAVIGAVGGARSRQAGRVGGGVGPGVSASESRNGFTPTVPHKRDSVSSCSGPSGHGDLH